ncbi:MAG: hypothetical protein HC819_01960 [Cyclobacteriaceae bacterium]|nr:hypothetical protein [Cyclobacteriaceae bacterium]
MKIIIRFLLVAATIGCLYFCAHKADKTPVSPKEKVMQLLEKHTLQLWYPRVVDTIHGGYFSTFAFDWAKSNNQQKFIVTQARHIWTLSNALAHFPDKPNYLAYANHGYLFLKNHMWDGERGGFFQLTDSTGAVPLYKYSREKRAYGNAFAIYGLAAYHQISGDTGALDLAVKAFRWLDDHAHDPKSGGYYQYLDSLGQAIPRAALQDGYQAPDKILVGLKDYNSSIHIMEAFTVLYQAWPDDTLRQRLQEMYHIVSDTMMDNRGFLKMHFYPDWSPVPDQELIDLAGEGNFNSNHISFGHDVETAFLLLETAASLGISEEEVLPLAKNW